jgi:hypothetical protein
MCTWRWINTNGNNSKLMLLFNGTSDFLWKLSVKRWLNTESMFFKCIVDLHLGSVLVNNQLDTQFFFRIIYFNSLHVSSTPVLIIRRISCINTTSGIWHSMQVTVSCVGLDGTAVPSKETRDGHLTKINQMSYWYNWFSWCYVIFL